MYLQKLLVRVTTSVAACLLAVGVSAASAHVDNISAEPATAPLVAMHSVYMNQIPRGSFYAPRRGEMPELLGMTRERWEALKAAARYNRVAPFDSHPIPEWYDPAGFTPGPLASFAGLSNSPATCPYFGNGCAPPDMAIAASSSFVVQAVNTSVAVYSTSGVIKPGFPKDFTHFFRVPPPTPAGCDPGGPFTSDPRAFYDPVKGRFWLIALQLEDPPLLGTPCDVKTVFWAAVSKTSDPTGGWNVYAFDMQFGASPKQVADFTQIGLDASAFYFGGNMYDAAAVFYNYDEVFAADKAKMEAGVPVVAHGLKKIRINGVYVDTLQPVLVEGPSPSVGLFVDAFNINSGGGVCSSGCSGINVFAMKGALTAHPTLTFKTAPSMTYTLSSLADQPGAPSSVETSDERISGSPVLSGGAITWAHETAVSHGSTTVPGIHWGQVKPTISATGIITAASTTQEGIVSFTGGRAATFGTLMPDKTGDLLMVFDSMSSTIFPGEYYTSRLSSDPAGRFGPPKTIKKGVATFTFCGSGGCRWGDYEATGYDGMAGDNIWFASQYSNSAGNWSTFIGKAKP